jgi:hypothetical protein
MIVEQLVEWRLAGETEVLGENLPQRHFVHHKSQHDQTQARTRAAAVGSQQLTAWAMVRPILIFILRIGYSSALLIKIRYLFDYCIIHCYFASGMVLPLKWHVVESINIIYTVDYFVNSRFI